MKKLTAVIFGLVVSAGAMANPMHHLHRLNHQENKIIHHDQRAIHRAYHHGNVRRAHRLTHQMHHQVHHIEHKRQRVIHHHYS